MANLLFSNKAVEDLTNIWNYTVEMWSEAQADRYYNQLVNTCRQLAAQSDCLGRAYEEIMTGLYGYRTGRHVVFYRSLPENTVEIVRILHERMDFYNLTRFGGMEII